VMFCSDEHTTLVAQSGAPTTNLKVGDKLRVTPAHIDPTMAMHSVAWIMRSDEILDCWQIDLRGW